MYTTHKLEWLLMEKRRLSVSTVLLNICWKCYLLKILFLIAKEMRNFFENQIKPSPLLL